MSGLETVEKKEWSNYVIADSLKEQNDLVFSVEKFQVETILNGLAAYINPMDLWKKDDLVNYICTWKLWSKERKDLEKMVNYMIYWLHENVSINENPWARKLKYILDNYWRDINAILIEIKNKEQEMKPKSSSKPKEEKKEKWIFDLESLSDKINYWFNYWINKLSEFWNIITQEIPYNVKVWVKDNLFSIGKQKEAGDIYEIYKKLKWKEKPDPLPFYLAMQWYNKLKNSIWNRDHLTVIDYSKPPSKNRLYVINMKTLTVENCVKTWHGKNSWNMQETSRFSNKNGSKQTSIGFKTKL